MFGAEPWTEAMRTQLEAELGLRRAQRLRAVGDRRPGRRRECPQARDGLHVMEDHFLVEVIDPETGAPVPDGTDGELVFTTLTKEAMPLLRYRTGDIASLNREPCVCGRTVRPHEPDPRPPRRHADRPRREPLPVPDRARAARVEGVSPALPARRRAPGPARRAHRASARARATDLADRVKHAIREQIGVTVRVQLARGRDPAQRGQGRARDRQTLARPARASGAWR